MSNQQRFEQHFTMTFSGTHPTWLIQLYVVIATHVLLLFGIAEVKATGSADLFQETDDPVMLLIGDPGFGNFASFGATSTNSLKVRIAAPGEIIYFGFSRAYFFSGLPQTTGAYMFRVVRASDGAVVHGPVSVSSANENLSSLSEAAAGPEDLFPGGYQTNNNYRYAATEPGEYYIEFAGLRYLGLWDITVGLNGQEKPGRVYSQNWAFRVPEMSPELPGCIWGAELNSHFYSYTSDGFVTLIDFENSGFQPLSFNLAFNRKGPGNSGNPQLDRMSVENINLTESSAEHLIFIEEPDPVLFPDGVCGEAIVESRFRCIDALGFCLPVRTNAPGQIEVVLDFDDNLVYDEATDVLLVHRFVEGEELSTCMEWDGFLPNGTRPRPDVRVNIVAKFTQGIQHWALYDGELMRDGFCITPVRPLCGNTTSSLFYDDRNINAVSGTPSPNDGRQGCDCETANCRTWANFNPNTDDCGSINDGVTTGYGDKNTLNTWWFASSQVDAFLGIPLVGGMVQGPALHCPGEPVTLAIEWFSSDDVGSIAWTSPEGTTNLDPMTTEVVVNQSGTYQANITDVGGCSFSAEYFLADVVCNMEVQLLGTVCNDNGTQSNPNDDTFTATVSINGSNSSGWFSDSLQSAGNYDTIIVLGPFLISEGGVTIDFADNDFNCCSEVLIIDAPQTCSAQCAINQTLIRNNLCDDNGTPTDPSDDVFTFEVMISGNNLSSHWVSTGGATGPYGEFITFGPYPIGVTQQVVGFRDSGQESCFINVTVTPPARCSNLCAFDPQVSNVICNDNGTPYNPQDDYYTFDLFVQSINATNVGFQVNGEGIWLYGRVYQMGPYLVNEGLLSLNIQDLITESCFQEMSIMPPAACSELCGIEIVDIRTFCDDALTEGAEDDTYYYEILVTSLDVNATTWRASDGTSGAYGVYVRSAEQVFAQGEVTLLIQDQLNLSCFDETSFFYPLPELLCPEENVEVSYSTSSVHQINDELTQLTAELLTGDDLSCWLQSDFLENGLRYFDRTTFSRRNEPGLRTELFSFYLFADQADSSMVGSVFNVAEYESIDCCNLLNPGPLAPWRLNANEGPILPESMYPPGMQLAQQFSVLMNSGQEYTLVTTSWSAELTGNYTWMIVSAATDSLAFEDPTLDWEFFPEVQTTSVLRTFQRPRFEGQTGSNAYTIDNSLLSYRCGEVELVFFDDLAGNCDSSSLTRSYNFLIADTLFLPTECGQQFDFLHLGLEQVVMPANNLRFTCTDVYPRLENGHPHPDFTGYPAIYDMGQTVFLNENSYADLVAGFYDVDSLDAMGNRVIYRFWEIQDFCTQETSDYVQRFKFDDGGEVFLACPTSNHYCPILEEDIMLFSTTAFSCVNRFTVPMPELINACDTFLLQLMARVYYLDTLTDGSIDTVTVRTVNLNQPQLPFNLETGDYFIEYTGVNPVNNHPISVTCRIRVADLVQPYPICRALINVSLPSSGAIRLFPHSINQGSYDNCDGFTLTMRREYAFYANSCDSTGLGNQLYSNWANTVDFFCCDAGYTYSVDLQVTDAVGNTNFCTTKVRVEDNTLPYCTGLVDVQIGCDSLPDGFNPYDTLSLQSTFGVPQVIDNCNAYSIEAAPLVAGDICNPETILRRFLAVDQNGNVATNYFYQTITVTPSLNYLLKFPRDTETDCVNELNIVEALGTGCDSITIDFIEAILTPVSNECRRVARTYTITNWCEWDGFSAPVVISRDEDCNGVEGENDVWVIRRPNEVYIDADSLYLNDFPLENSRGTACGDPTNPQGYWRESNSTGRWQYTQYLRIFDTVAPRLVLEMNDSICISDNTCTADVMLSITVDDACQVTEGSLVVSWDLDSDGVIDGTRNVQEGPLSNFPVYGFNEAFPAGDHTLVITVTDDCGNSATVNRSLTIIDCYVPVLNCSDGRIYNLEALVDIVDIDNDGIFEEAAVIVAAADLGSCEFSDCSGEFIYSINRVGAPVNINQQFLYLDCDDRYRVDLEVYIWDNANNPISVQPDGSLGGRNWRSCTVNVFVQDPNLVCNNCQDSEGLTIAGRVKTFRGSPMENVEISLNTTNQQMMTSATGRFQFQAPIGNNYGLQAYKNDDVRSGLSTVDMLFLQSHIIQRQLITDPYLLLAADINADGSITTLDLLQLQAVILGSLPEFPTNTSWRFVSHNWDGATTPAAVYELGTLEACGFDFDMVGVKIGDLNQSSYATNGLAQTNARTTTSPLGITLEDQQIEAGKSYEVSLMLPVDDTYLGGQVSLHWPAHQLIYNGVESPELSRSSFNASATERGLLLFNYAATLKSEHLLTLSFTATASGQLSDLLTLCQDCNFTSEVYVGHELAATPLELNWTEPITPTEPAVTAPQVSVEIARLTGLTPNPVREQARIGVLLPDATTAVFYVTDLAGRRMHIAEVELVAGQNQLTLATAAWPAGIYIYTFQLKDRLLSDRLIKQ